MTAVVVGVTGTGEIKIRVFRSKSKNLTQQNPLERESSSAWPVTMNIDAKEKSGARASRLPGR
jgi:hypothetical protein